MNLFKNYPSINDQRLSIQPFYKPRTPNRNLGHSIKLERS